ncbi:MAG: ribonuclease H-like domain-containing protein [Lachnospiraceae bacterium]|nr:ribonuclease H-like domain-containing protein [Lachnospiraceae bacterium]
MLQFEHILDCPAGCFAISPAPADQTLFFDIETTGFSPESSYVYLIGCAFLKDGAVRLRQWFLDDISEEKQLIREFGEFAKNFRALVHYNGTTFDLPYLQKKARRHRLPAYFLSMPGAGCNEETYCEAEGHAGIKLSAPYSLDLYRQLLPCKKLRGLKDLKQKTVEEFLGITRGDVFSGGDLIPVYTEFVGRYRYECITHGNPFWDMDTAGQTGTDVLSVGTTSSGTKATNHTVPHETPDFVDTGLTNMPESPAKALLYVLLLHNCEDIRGLLGISPLLCLPRLISGDFTVEILPEHAADPPETGVSCLYRRKVLRLDTGWDPVLLSACFRTEIAKQLPCDAQSTSSPVCVSLSAASSGSLLLVVPVFSGTLKYFFGDYKEYYYLPLEDCAIHKSVAQFVDKEYRRKATKETCYQKKEGHFLPQPEQIITPAFRLHAKDRFSYFEDAEIPADPDVLKNWAQSLLAWLLDRTAAK